MFTTIFNPNFNNWNNIDAIIAALQANGFQSRMEREGGSNKRHQLLGVGLLFIDSAEQYVIPCYNDMEFDMNPVILREGKLIVSTKVVGKASSVGHKWFESWVTEGNGQFSMFMTTQEKVEEAEATRTPPPIHEPAVTVAKKDEAPAAAETTATETTTTLPPADTNSAAA